MKDKQRAKEREAARAKREKVQERQKVSPRVRVRCTWIACAGGVPYFVGEACSASSGVVAKPCSWFCVPADNLDR